MAFATAGLYWQKNGLNELADAREFVAITKRINGGTNGLADRQHYYARALAVLGVGVTRAMRAAPLTRGHEAIVADAKAPARKRAATKKHAKGGGGRCPRRGGSEEGGSTSQNLSRPCQTRGSE